MSDHRTPVTNFYYMESAKDFIKLLTVDPHKLTVTMFSFSACGPCQSIKPTFVKTLPSKYPNVNFVYIDRDNFEDEYEDENGNDIEDVFMHDVRSFPTFKYYHLNRVFKKFSGAYRRKLIQSIPICIDRIKTRSTITDDKVVPELITDKVVEVDEVVPELINDKVVEVDEVVPELITDKVVEVDDENGEN